MARGRLVLSVRLQLSGGKNVVCRRSAICCLYRLVDSTKLCFFFDSISDDHGERHSLRRSHFSANSDARLLQRRLENDGRRRRSEFCDLAGGGVEIVSQTIMFSCNSPPTTANHVPFSL